jgi:hypothetical protein
VTAKTTVVMALIWASAATVGCGGGRRPARPAPPRAAAGLPASPCRGVDPWRGASLRSCSALVSRWAPVHGMHLTARPSARVRATCEQARRLARIPVVCPPLVPTDGVVADRDLYGAEGPPPPDTAGDFYLLTFNNGQNAGHIHWIVGAGRGETVERYLFNPRIWVARGRVRRLGRRRYGPWPVTFYRLPPYPSGGELGGHDLALARLSGTTYFVSLHGRTHHDTDAAMLIAILLTVPSGG